MLGKTCISEMSTWAACPPPSCGCVSYDHIVALKSLETSETHLETLCPERKTNEIEQTTSVGTLTLMLHADQVRPSRRKGGQSPQVMYLAHL